MRRILPVVLWLAIHAVSVVAAPRQAQAPPPPASGAADAEADAYYLFMLARHQENAGNVNDAIATLKRAIKLEPGSAELRAELASIYARQNMAVDAIDMAEEALKADPANREANRLLGSIYAALAEQKRPVRPGDDPSTYPARAIAALEKARHPSQMDLGLDFALGRLYSRAGRHEDAIKSLLLVFEQQPEYSEGGMLLAAAQEETGQVDRAIETLETTVQASPRFFRAYVRLIELYERQRRWKDAAAAYERAQALNPGADLTGGRAAALINGGAPREAQALLEASLAKSATPDASLLYLLAEAQRQAKDFDGASATARRLRTAFPDDVRGIVIETQLHLAAGRRAEALNGFADLVKRVPEEPSFAYQYAQLLDEDDRLPEAERVLRALLTRDPKNATALNALGYMFADRGERLDEAVRLLRQALELEPGNPSYLDSLGWAYFKQGQLAAAESPLAEAAAKLPDNSVIQDHLGDLRFRQQRYAEAVTAWERALAGDGEAIDRALVEKKLREARALAVRK
jgi:tetratricopeptide (TPR) repeat protein